MLQPFILHFLHFVDNKNPLFDVDSHTNVYYIFPVLSELYFYI